MGQPFNQVVVTYVTHRWIMLVLAAWLVCVVALQGLMVISDDGSPSDRMPIVIVTIGMPLCFAPALLVAQAKAQFAHSRRLLLPGFAAPHLLVAAGLLALLTLIYPLLGALSLGFDPLGTVALAVAIAAPMIWSVQTNRFLGLLVGLAALYSTITPTGARWWLLEAPAHRPIHAAILLAGLGLLAAWLWRLALLREEMDDYQSLMQWQMARKSGMEVTEQRKILAEYFRRNRLAGWISDAWLARVGGYHDGSPYRVARLLRYGFGQLAEMQGLYMATFFFAFTFFLAKYGFQGDKEVGFGDIAFYLMFAAMFPGFLPSEMLAHRRPRIAVELTRPLRRRQLVDGLLAAVAWNAAVIWLAMNAGLVLQAYFFLPSEQFTPLFLGTMLVNSACVTLALTATTLRIAVWTSQIQRLIVLWLSAMVFMIPVIGWQVGREKYGDGPFLVVAALLAAYAAWMATRARRAWMDVEVG